MLVASLFSSILGTLIPGAVYLKQTLDFTKPVYSDGLVVGRVSVTRLRHVRKLWIATCDTVVEGDDGVKVRGQADVWLPDTPASGATADR